MRVEQKIVRVLIVDDQEPFRAAAGMVVDLTDGFEVAGSAETGEAAVEMLASEPVDLVLMDINLPGIDGLEATRRIVSANAAIRVIVLSTYEAGEYEQRSLDAGAIAFISKSDFGPAALQEVWTGNT